MAPDAPRIVCVTPVKNEAWILDLFLRTASLWADDIVISDQMSDDGSDQIAERHPKVRLVRYDGPYHESNHRRFLVAATRRLVPGPKVLVVLDADELLAATVLESAEWQRAIRSAPGTAIRLPWMSLRPGLASAWEAGCPPFAVVDDGAPFDDDRMLHCARGPMSEQSPCVTLRDVPVLHFQYVDRARMRSKHRWYQCFDRIANPARSANQIFRQYHHMYAVPGTANRLVEPAWFSGYQRRGIDAAAMIGEGPCRWDREVLDLFDVHGTRRFAREWIWDQDWVELGRSAGRPDPARVPRSSVAGRTAVSPMAPGHPALAPTAPAAKGRCLAASARLVAPVMRFSLIHPSRQRLSRADAAIHEWMSHAGGRHPVEYFLSVDEHDPDLAGYRDLAARRDVRLVVGSNRSLVDAVNRAAALATGDLLIVVSDDFGCPQHWDDALAGIAGTRRDIAIQVHDGNDAKRMTLPIVGRALYERLGYVYYPGYFSMFADDELTSEAKRLGALVDAHHLVFPHRHYSFGLAEIDPTYARQNAQDKWWSGWRLYETRLATGFGRAPVSPAVVWRLVCINAYYLMRKAGSRVRRGLVRLGLSV